MLISRNLLTWGSLAALNVGATSFHGLQPDSVATSFMPAR